MIDNAGCSIDTKVESKPVLDYVDIIFKDEEIVEMDFFQKTYNYKYPKCPAYYETEPSFSMNERDQAFQKKITTKYGPLDLTGSNGQVMIDFDQMIKNQCTISPENQNGGKLMNLVFDSDKVEKLLKKCKADNLKLTGAINLLMVLAFKIVNERNNHYLKRFHYMNSISLRQFLPEPIKSKAASFSYMANVVPVAFDLEEQPIEYFLDNFWSLAKLESNTLHQKIANNQQFVRWDWTKLKLGEDELACSYYLSNIGAYKTHGVLKIIDLKESYMTLNINKKEKNSHDFLVSTVSINNTLCWSFMYHSTSYGSTIEEIRNLILDLSDKIVANL